MTRPNMTRPNMTRPNMTRSRMTRSVGAHSRRGRCRTGRPVARRAPGASRQAAPSLASTAHTGRGRPRHHGQGRVRPAGWTFPPGGGPPAGIGPPVERTVPGPREMPVPGLMDERVPGLMDTPADTSVPPPGWAAALLRRAGHSPGRHGTQAAGYRRRLLAGLGAAALVGAGILGGLAIGHSGRSPLPAGYQWHTVPAAETGTAAGFTMAVPNGWHVSTHGLVTDVIDPAGPRSMQVDLTPFEADSAFGETSLLAERAVTDGSFPGYRRVALRSFLFHDSLGAVWNFTWQEPGLGRVDVLDVLFRGHAQAGSRASSRGLGQRNPFGGSSKHWTALAITPTRRAGWRVSLLIIISISSSSGDWCSSRISHGMPASTRTLTASAIPSR